MKKFSLSFLIASCSFLAFSFSSVSAEQTHTLEIKDGQIYIDGKSNKPNENDPLIFSSEFLMGSPKFQTVLWTGNRNNEDMKAAPYIKDGRTYVPLRYLGYANGLQDNEISWNTETGVASLNDGNIDVKVPVGSNTFFVNGSELPLDAPAEIINGRVMLPLRQITEALGNRADYRLFQTDDPSLNVKAGDQYIQIYVNKYNLQNKGVN